MRAEDAWGLTARRAVKARPAPAPAPAPGVAPSAPQRSLGEPTVVAAPAPAPAPEAGRSSRRPRAPAPRTPLSKGERATARGERRAPRSAQAARGIKGGGGPKAGR